MRPISTIVLLASTLALPATTHAQKVSETPHPPRAGFDFTVMDAPYNVAEGLRGPSMRQALDLSLATYEVGHASIERLLGQHRGWARAAITLVDIATTLEVALPLTSVWVHEEFHRAIMGRRGVDSFNDVYKLDLDATWIAVSHVNDDDIVQL